MVKILDVKKRYLFFSRFFTFFDAFLFFSGTFFYIYGEN